MRRVLILSIFLVMILIPVKVNASEEGSDPHYILVNIEPNIIIPGADYPQQDGGSEDRLFQYRSMWLEGYQIINHSEVQKVIKVARDSNINCVTPLINAHYLGTFYNSSFHPRYRDLTWDFDPTMDLIREAHKYNIKVMPWFHTMIDSYAITAHPDWAQVSSNGARSGAWLNPTLPEVQNYLAGVLYQLFRDYPLDGIHLDAIRYPGSTYGYDDYSVERYFAEGWNDFNAFRRQQMTEVTEAIYNSISSIKPYVWIGADIGAGSSTRQNAWFQDSERWSQMGIIDFVTPMTYTLISSNLETSLKDNINRHSCPVVCGNYVYVPEDTSYGAVPDEETGIAILQNQTERAINAGALGTCFFAYKFMADHPSYHRSLREGVFSEKALCPLKKQTVHVSDHEWEFELDQDREGWRTTKMGNYYPYEGVWSIIGISEPTFMSPLLNITASGLNVIEISMKAESRVGNITIQWSFDKPIFMEENSVTIPLVDTGDWNLYSTHIDRSPFWIGTIRYIRIIPKFHEKTNITMDLIRMTWMPDCIRSWAYLGPFYTGEGDALLYREFIEDETSVMPTLGDVESGRQWRKYFMDRDQVDLRFVLGHVQDAVTYSHVYIVSKNEGIVEMRHGNSDGARIWLNGKEVFTHDTIRRAYPDQNLTYVLLNEGINTLLMKQVVYNDENSFFMRFTAPGNQTLEGVEYYDQLPLLDAPINLLPDGDWTPSSDVLVTWDPPMNNIGLDHYEWKVDNGEFHKVVATNTLVTGLDDGDHHFTLRCVDELGFPGKEGSILIRVDLFSPIITEPISVSDISLIPEVKWEWDVIYEPISSISEYLVTVENWKQGTSDVHYSVKDLSIYEKEFVLSDNIKDGYRFRITVKAVSGSGNVFSISSKNDVLVDLTPPLKPYGFKMQQVEPGSRHYWLSWVDSIDNTNGGIDHYEVWWSLDWQEWELLTITENTNLTVERPLGKSLSVKVRAKDISSHHSDFTKPLFTENQAPLPKVIIPDDLIEGVPIHFNMEYLIDPDGDIKECRWSIDNVLISNMRDFTITLQRGKYDLEVLVIDDQGISGKASHEIVVSEDKGMQINGSISNWLEDTSRKTVIMPDVILNHWNNETVNIEKNETNGSGPILKENLMDALLIIIGIPLLLIIFLSFLFLSLMELSGSSGNIPKEAIIEKESPPINDKKRILQEFMIDQSVQKVIDLKGPKRQTLRSSSTRSLPQNTMVTSNKFKAAPSLSEIRSFKQQEVEVEWDEEEEGSLEEWEEVEV